MDEIDVRKKIIELCLYMNSSGLNQGTSGNISARYEDRMLITPSGIPYEALEPADIASMSVADNEYEWIGPHIPSSEWHFHRAILQSNEDFGAVFHAHSMYSTILSIGHREIPPCHYMIAAFGGNSVRCAEYATYGTPELSNSILSAMKDRSACLIGNHGMVVAEVNLDKAIWAAVELETLAKQYYHADLANSVTLLEDEEIAKVTKAFSDYGPRDKT